LFEIAIKDLQHKEPHGASIPTMVKTNFTKNFGLEIENQYTRFISLTRSIKPISFTNSTRSIGFTSSIGNINAIGFIKNTIITKKMILEGIT
jgi:hypothetical protein